MSQEQVRISPRSTPPVPPSAPIVFGYPPDAPPPSFLVSLAACSTLLLFSLLLLAVPLSFVAGVVCLIVGWHRLFWFFVLVMLGILSFYPRHVKQWRRFCTHPLWKLWLAYFRFSLVMEQPNLNSGPYLIPEIPHGIFPVGLFLATSLVYMDNMDHEMFGNHPFVGAGADVILMLPIWRHIFGWLGVVRADRSTLSYHMAKGAHMCIIPGGIAELLLTSHKEERVFLRKRKGFVKLAIQHGFPILPCYHFGNSEVLHQLHSPLLQWVSRKLRMSLVLCWGRFGLPIPYPARVIEVVGRPIHVQCVENPTQEQIDTVHAQFMEELIRMFDAHKHRVGWEDRTLQIM